MSKPPRGKTQVKKTDTAQSKRFVETAKKIGGNEDPEVYDRVFKRVANKHDGKPPKN